MYCLLIAILILVLLPCFCGLIRIKIGPAEEANNAATEASDPDNK